MEIDKGILEEFSIEARELLDEAEDALLLIDKNGEDLKNIYDKVFRAFHSLKGSSGMIGFDELQRHLHLLEDYLQKSKSDLNLFKSSTDYYLKGIDAAKKILDGEVVQFVYEVYSSAGNQKREIQLLKKKKILFLSDSVTSSLSEKVYHFQERYDYVLKMMTIGELGDKGLANEEYSVLFSDISIDKLRKLIPEKKIKLPLLYLIENIPSVLDPLVFQYVKLSDETARIESLIKCSLKISDYLDMFEKSKGIMMYMFSDLEEYLLKTNKVEIQKTLSSEIKHFIKTYSK